LNNQAAIQPKPKANPQWNETWKLEAEIVELREKVSKLHESINEMHNYIVCNLIKISSLQKHNEVLNALVASKERQLNPDIGPEDCECASGDTTIPVIWYIENVGADGGTEEAEISAIIAKKYYETGQAIYRTEPVLKIRRREDDSVGLEVKLEDLKLMARAPEMRNEIATLKRKVDMLTKATKDPTQETE
jgi:hypothetical protein